MDLEALTAARGTLVLERIEGQTYARRGPLPDWCQALPDSGLHRRDEPFALESAFPFLSAFLEDAGQIRRAGVAADTSSGFWTETGTRGEELHLEAVPLCVDDTDTLVITRDERLFRQQRLVLQRARELRLAHDALAREIEQKDVLLHTIVYEMAPQLRSVLNTLSLLSEAPLGEGNEWVRTGFAAAMGQKQLIAEVLEAFSAEHDAQLQLPSPERAPDLGAAIADALSELAPIAQQREVELQFETCESPCPVLGEARRLGRVLAVLVGQAVRNSLTGGVVRVSVRHEGGFVQVAVDDDGPPIPIELLPRLFEKFAPSEERDLGSGLGLYFCRITLERWGGGTGYERREQGARFWIRLRTAECERGTEVRP